MKKTSLRLLLFVAAASLFGACSDNDGLVEFNYIAAKADDSDDWGIIDINSGEYICEDEFENAPSFIGNDRFIVENSEGTYDVYDVDDVKKPVNKDSYADITDFMKSDVALAVLPGGKINIIDTDCDVVAELPADITECYHFQNDRAVFKNSKGKYGVIDEKGNVVVEAKYDDCNATYSDDGIAIFITKKGDKQGDDHSNYTYHAVDKSGSELFTLSGKDYTSIGYFNDGKLSVIKNGKFLLLNKKGEEICKLGSAGENDYAGMISPINGKIVFCKDGKYGLKDSEGETLIRAKYDVFYASFDGEYIAKKDDDWGLINAEDETILSFKYEMLGGLKSNRFLIKRDDEWRIIDREGETINKDDISEYSAQTYSSVTSQYVDPKDYAQKIFNDFTTTSCLGYSANTTVSDFMGSEFNDNAYYYNGENQASVTTSDGKTCQLLFSGPIASPEYGEYGYSYGSSFNPSTSLLALATTYDISRYDIVEDRIAKEFDNLLSSKGYTALGSSAPHLYKSKDGTVVGLGYSDGKLTLYYYFHEVATYASVVRNRRTHIRSMREELATDSLAEAPAVTSDPAATSDFDEVEATAAADTLASAPAAAAEDDWGELESPPADDL